MGFRDWLVKPALKGLFDEAGWPYTAPPTPAGTNWEVIERSFDKLKEGVLSDYGQVGDPYKTISTVHACVEKVARNIAQVPVIETGSPEIDKLLRNPTPKSNRFNFWQGAVSGLELHGRSYIVGQSFRRVGDSRVPLVMFHVPDSQMGYDADAKKFFIGAKANRKAQYDVKDVVVVEYLDAQSALESARLEVMLLFYSLQYNINFFKNGGQLPGFLRKRDNGRSLTPERQHEIETAFKQRGGKAGDKRHVPVFNDLDYVNIGTGQRDMEYLALLNAVERRIVKAFGIPYALFDETDTTFSNMAEARQHFWNSKLLPIIRLMEATFDDQVTDRWGWPATIRWDVDAVPELQTNVNTASEAALRYYQMGVPFTEINTRMALGFGEFDGADVPYSPAPQMELSAEKEAEIARVHKVKEAIAREKSLSGDELALTKEKAIVLERIKSMEADAFKDVSKFWSSQYKAVAEKLKECITERKAINENIGFDDAAFGVFLESLPWEHGLNETLHEHIKRAVDRGAYRTISGFGFDFNLPPERAQAFIVQREMLMKQLTEDVKEQIRDELFKGVSEGLGADELSSRLSHRFNVLSRARSHAIANTEMVAAYNGGRIAGMQELGIERKEWLHTGSGENSRPVHMAMSGERIHVGAKFSNGCDYPGSGPVDEVVNCRCSVLSVIGDDDEQRLLDEAARRRRQ